MQIIIIKTELKYIIIITSLDPLITIVIIASVVSLSNPGSILMMCTYVRVRHAQECRSDVTQECREHDADTYS